jgi:hypothetical protein
MMLPRFLKTFLLASLLLILPTLFILYQKHSSGTEWNEWSLTSGSWESWNVEQAASSDRQDSALYFEDHWDAGGAAPKYQSSRIIDADREEDEEDGAQVYRVGETLIRMDELEAYQKWKKTHASEAPFNSDAEDAPSHPKPWREEAGVHGTVIMPKLGNATAK